MIVTPSNLITTLRGSAGSAVFTNNQGIINVRTRVKPSNPISLKSQNYRAHYKWLSTVWKQSSEANRQRLIDSAKEWNNHNRYSWKKPLNGFNLFMSIILNKSVNPYVVFSLNPIPSACIIPVLDKIWVQWDGSQLMLRWPTRIGLQGSLMIYASPQVSSGISKFHTYRLIKVLQFVGPDVSGDLLPAWKSVFSVFNICNSKIFFKVCFMNNDTGLRGLYSFAVFNQIV
jgi:hypothetical protein